MLELMCARPQTHTYFLPYACSGHRSLETHSSSLLVPRRPVCIDIGCGGGWNTIAAMQVTYSIYLHRSSFVVRKFSGTCYFSPSAHTACNHWPLHIHVHILRWVLMQLVSTARRWLWPNTLGRDWPKYALLWPLYTLRVASM